MLFLGMRLLIADMKILSHRDRMIVWVVFLAYLCAMVYYVSYINKQPFAYGFGIPQADMLAHFRGAIALAKGAKWTDLAKVARRFEEIGISTIGYFLYTSFISWCIFVLPIFPTGINVYLIYVFQTFISLDTCLRFAKFVSREYKHPKTITVFLILALCVPYLVQAFQLMRDVYYMWAIASLLVLVSAPKHQKGKVDTARAIYRFKIASLLALSIAMRYYSLLLTFPLMLYYNDQKNLAVYAAVGELGVLLVGGSVVNILKNLVGLGWKITAPELKESIQFFLFPNIFNQSRYLWYWKEQFGTTIDVSGCNVPGVYYAMSVWNIWTIPLAAAGIAGDWKRKKQQTIIWTSILLSVVLLYSITYDAIDTRHKFFMSLPMCFLAVRGVSTVKKWVPILIYNIIIFFVALLVLFGEKI